VSNPLKRKFDFFRGKEEVSPEKGGKKLYSYIISERGKGLERLPNGEGLQGKKKGGESLSAHNLPKKKRKKGGGGGDFLFLPNKGEKKGSGKRGEKEEKTIRGEERREKVQLFAICFGKIERSLEGRMF